MTRLKVSSTTLLSSLLLIIMCRSSLQYKVVPDDAQDDVPRQHLFFHEQTLAVIEFDTDNVLRNCSVIEAYEKSEAVTLLSELSLSATRPRKTTFQQMLSLMELCDDLERTNHPEDPSTNSAENSLMEFQKNPNYYSILSGILPGTKWCGLGDLAHNYFDIGTFANVDRCCRNHDLCPVKVRAYKKRYGLTNLSFFSKSHCDCDAKFYKCLKSQNHKMARVMGKIYFNVMKVPCIEEVPSVERSPNALKLRFTESKKLF